MNDRAQLRCVRVEWSCRPRRQPPAKALGSGRRAEIVDLLAQGERSDEEIATEFDQSIANTSHHLRALARAGLVATRRDGTRIYYSLASEGVGELWAAVRDVAESHLAGLERLASAYLGDHTGIDVIDRAELASRLRNGASSSSLRLDSRHR